MSKLSLHKAGHDPRAAALVGLHQVLHQGKDSQAAVDDALSSSSMVPTDKRLCTELVYGSLRHFLRLEWFVNRHLSNPDKLPPEMRLALVQALYEMAFLRIPARASVNWTVGHVRNRFSPGLAKVANGVLRAMQRGLKAFQDKDFYMQACDGKRAEALGLWYAVPAWVVELWERAYGEEATAQYLGALQQPALSGLRLNMRAPGWEEARTAFLQVEEIPEGKAARRQPPLAVGRAGLAFPATLPWEARDLVKQGRASRQSAAAYEALEVLEPGNWQQPIWDACAGRGNKTLALLEQGVVVTAASDPAPRRLQGLQPEMERLKLSSPELRVLTLPAQEAAEQLQADGTRFGTVLVDAPCSGLGTINRRPEIRFRRTPEDVASLMQTQAAILDAAKTCLQPGGHIAYITCTLNPAENEEQVAAFIQRTPGATLQASWQTPADSPLREFFFAALVRML